MEMEPLPLQALETKYDLFAEIARRFRLLATVEPVLVGGSAFEWHFPDIYASDDLDVVIQATVARVREFEGVLLAAGFSRTGRCWSHPALLWTVDVVGTTLALAPGGLGAEVVVARAPVTGAPFTVFSATTIWCDRAIAWEALPQSQRDARQTRLALERFRAKIDESQARAVLKAAGVLGSLRRRPAALASWATLADVFVEP